MKTFADGDRRQVNITPVARSTGALNKLVRPPHRPQNGRVPAELKTYEVTGNDRAQINENDGDIHLVIGSPSGKTISAEAAEPACAQKSREPDRMNAARLVAQDVKVDDKVTAVGVGFFDFTHGQTGHADNFLELHPLLSLKHLG